MREIRALLVDDEPIACEGLRFLLAKHPDVKLIGECRDGNDAVRQIRRLAPDLVFLDVQMPTLDAFGVLNELDGEVAPLFVFVTAHENYALRAFDVQAIDYLLKPVQEDRLGRALDRVRRQVADRHASDSDQSADVGGVGAKPASGRAASGVFSSSDSVPIVETDSYLSRLVVRTGRRSVVIRVADIDWIAADDYCVNIMVNGRRHLLRASLSSLETRLDPKVFVRVHRSAVVNVTRVREWHEHSFRNLTLVLADGTRIAASRRRKAQLLGLFSDVSGAT